LLAILFALCGKLEAKELSVVYLNPGHYIRDAGWTQRSWFMQAAAAQLGWKLEVLYAGRDRLLMVEQAKEVAARPVPPDYVIVVNEMEEGVQMLEAFRGKRTRVLLMHNDLTPEQRRKVGNERERLSNWIGTILTDERAGARAMIAELYRRASSEPMVLGIGGPEVTPVATERAEAVRSYVAGAGRGRVLQVVPGNWTREDGREKARWLLARHPDANIFWGANDTVALGILDAVVEADRQDRIAVGGIGGFAKAIESVATGGMAVTVGGNGFIGAWAIVLIHDHARGHDFAGTDGVVVNSPTVAAIVDAKSATRFKMILDEPERIDFRQFSRAENRNLKAYDFSFQAVLAAFR
jgi:ABC-type sugar transport system substrate-binding protein